MEDFTLERADKVSKREDYTRAYKSGKRFETKSFWICVSPNIFGRPRMGIGISRRIKGAVKRNRIKRLLREFFRLHKTCFQSSSDYIFSVRRLPADLSYHDLEREFKSLPFIRTC